MKTTYNHLRQIISRPLLAFLAVLFTVWECFRPRLLAANVNSTWFESLGEIKHATTPMYVDSGIAASTTGWNNRCLLYYVSLSTGNLALCGAGDKPFCSVDNENVLAAASASALSDPLAATVSPLVLYGRGQSMVLRAAGTIGIGKDVFTAASGQIQQQPNTAGVYWKIGVALTATTTAGDFVAVLPCEPEKWIVVAAQTSTGAAVATTTPATSSYGFTLAQAEAIITNLNAVQADLTAIYAGTGTAAGANATTGAGLLLAVQGSPVPQ
jgi:hypothetical protein